MSQTAEQVNTDWLQDLRRHQTRQLIEEGYIHVDEYGNATLTEKGKQRVANRLDKLPVGDEILIQIAVLQEHGITVSADI